jgi:hypothetical protein
MNAAQNWQAFHTALARYGLELKPHGNGLVIKGRHGKHAVKASAVDRSLSMKKLEARFGPYLPPQEMGIIQEQSRYQLFFLTKVRLLFNCRQNRQNSRFCFSFSAYRLMRSISSGILICCGQCWRQISQPVQWSA